MRWNCTRGNRWMRITENEFWKLAPKLALPILSDTHQSVSIPGSCQRINIFPKNTGSVDRRDLIFCNGAALDLPGSFTARSRSERWLVAHFNSITFAKIAVLAKGSEIVNLCLTAFRKGENVVYMQEAIKWYCGRIAAAYALEPITIQDGIS